MLLSDIQAPTVVCLGYSSLHTCSSGGEYLQWHLDCILLPAMILPSLGGTYIVCNGTPSQTPAYEELTLQAPLSF